MTSSKEGLSSLPVKVTRVAPDFPIKGCGHRGAKKERHKRKGSSTSGATKPSCKATWQMKYVCRRSRAYKDSDYPAIWRKLDKKAGNRRA